MNSKMEEQIHSLRRAAEIQYDKGDLVLSDMLNDAAVKLRVLASRLEAVVKIAGGEEE